jgi:hypothetical protein
MFQLLWVTVLIKEALLQNLKFGFRHSHVLTGQGSEEHLKNKNLEEASLLVPGV